MKKLILLILMFLVLFSSSFLKKQFKYVFVIIAFLLAYIIIGCKADTYMNGARDRFYAYTVPVKQVIETYPDYNIYFIKNTELDEYSVFPKYLQFTIPRRQIQVIQLEELYSLNDKNFLLLVNPEDSFAITEVNVASGLKLASTNYFNLYVVNVYSE